MRTIRVTDDKQLWRLADCVDGIDRSWPILATPAEDVAGQCWHVELALPVADEQQWQFCKTRLDAAAFDSDGTHWLIRPTFFERLAIHCKGITPAHYRKWGDVLPEQPVSPPAEKPQWSENLADDDFVRHCCAEIGYPDIPNARLLFHTFATQALRWLLELHRPFKLGFCTLYALPYRANWKGVLHAKHPNALATFRKKKRRDGILRHVGFFEDLHGTDLIEMPSDNVFGWSLEAVPEKLFENTARHAEVSSLKACEGKPGRYVQRWSNLLSRLHEQIMDVFDAWLEKASLPIATVDATLARNMWRLSPQRKRGKIRPSLPPVPPAAYTTDVHQGNREPVVETAADATPPEDLP